MKNGNEAKDALGDSRKRYRARGRDKKVRTALRAKIARFVTVPSEKKKKYLDQLTLSKLLRKYFGKTGDVFNVFQSTPMLVVVILLHCCFVEEVKNIYRLTCT